jgi:hypothetical protein
VAAAEALAVMCRGQGGEWLIACAVLAAVQHPWIWTREAPPRGAESFSGGESRLRIAVGGNSTWVADFGALKITLAIMHQVWRMTHLPLAESVKTFLSDCKNSGNGWLLAVRAAMLANRKGAWFMWRREYNSSLVSSYVETFKKQLKNRDRNDPERTAWTRHAQREGVGSIAVELIEIGTREALKAGDMSLATVERLMRAEIEARIERAKRWSPGPDPRDAKLTDLMDRYKTGLQVEAMWRLRRRKRIEDYRNELTAKAEAGTLPPIERTK